MSFWRTKLEAELRPYGKLAVAFSGGCDSTLLAEAARRVLGGGNVLLLLADSVLLPRREAERARTLAAAAGLRLETVPLDPLADEAVRANGPLRCYYCKKRIFTALGERARSLGFAVLADGANFDDREDYRPGAKAADELGVAHPLRELPKQAIRDLAREWKLPVWNLPAAACLASRIPAGTPLDREALATVEAGENAVAARGYTGFRVRRIGPETARLEFRADDLDRAEAERGSLETLLAPLGFETVEIALYRTGSMNRASGA
ncbi:ATP-dependent sacrificial sulfur transferase LarE [uncultured Victivallis sp.]|uniref:ATP-dependent sacrificial sulfur transferase LarE n=1 Tax=uncultured Victivallis sp. TaxID=354118 RepID=UPI0025884710|nr:ATP-dependent sacrificial sulfur transferase LarE [uncultured Victivallis sp.]